MKKLKNKLWYSYAFVWMDASWKSTIVERISNEINAVIVKDNNPKMSILRKTIEKSPLNDPDLRFDYYSLLSYNEVEIWKKILLKQWKNIVFDRNSECTIANNAAMWSIKAKNAKLEDITDFTPDLTFYLDVKKEERIKRMKSRWNITEADKLLIKEWWLLDKTDKEYKKFDDIHIRIDTTNKTINEVVKEVKNYILDNIKNTIEENSEKMIK